MQVKSIAECSKGSILGAFQGEHSAILSTFIVLPFVIKIFVLSIFEWPFSQVLLYLLTFMQHSAGLEVIKLEYSLRLKIKRNDCALF